jgi:hypothetical protein
MTMNGKDRDKIQDSINESQSDFEKNLVYLSAGALTLSLGFIEKIVSFDKSNNKWIVVISWGFLASSLLLNLASHLISVGNSTKAREEMDSGMEYNKLIERISCRNKIMRIINWTSYFLFVIGVVSVVIFCSINMN